jgi:hypothetical protein
VKHTQTIRVGKSQVELYAVRGQILDVETWTTVTGDGGGGNIDRDGGIISPVKIRSQVHQRLFLRGADGGEDVIELIDAKFAARPGHGITVLSGRWSGQTRGAHLAIHNHTTKQTTMIGNSTMFAAGRFLAFSAFALGAILIGVSSYYFYLRVLTGASLPNVVLGHEGPLMAPVGVLGFIIARLAWKKLTAKRADRRNLSSAVRAALQRIEAEA